MRPNVPPPSIKPYFSFPLEKDKDKEEKKERSDSLLSCERPYLVSKGFSCYTPR